MKTTFTYTTMNNSFMWLLAACMMLGLNSFAQVNDVHKHSGKTCGTMHVWEEMVRENPDLQNWHQDQDQAFRNFMERMNGFPKDGEKIIIPTVVHILHRGGPENISKAQVLNQIKTLNDDMQGLNADSALIPLHFFVKRAKLNIEFRLATIDPLGNCTDGIVRVFTPKTANASNQNGAKGVSYWNSFSYFNIWVVENIGFSIGGQMVLGYAQFPGTGLASTDGIVVRHNFFGSIGTASAQRGRTTTHEVGHWLGLRHIWGDAECGDDGVDDTPIHFGPNYNICWNNFPHNVGACVDSETNPFGEMFMNYMDYSNDNCMAMFTIQQGERMIKTLKDATLINYGPNGEVISVQTDLAFRRNISSPANLIATGTQEGAPIANCAPIADFSQNFKMICTGTAVQYRDNSFNADTYTRNWTFEGGTPGTSTAAQPNVNYANPGRYNTTLQVSNAVGSNSLTRQETIIVSSTTAENPTFTSESFATRSDFERWITFNNDDHPVHKWDWVGFGRTDNGCLRMENFNNIAGEVDELISPSYNLSAFQNQTPLNLQFWLAGAERGGVPADRLIISTSTDCGRTWTARRTLQGNQLSTAGLFSTFFSAWNPSFWTAYSVPISNVAGNTNVRFRFEFIRGDTPSNNIYIDDINIGVALNNESIEDAIGLNLFPNPAKEQLNLTFNLERPENLIIEIFDLAGKKVQTVYSGFMTSGTHNPAIHINELSQGMYMLRLKIGDKFVNKRFVKQ